MNFSVCVINWNWLEVLQPTIDNLRKERETVDLEIIVLDNGSVDGSAEWLKNQSDIIIICNENNLGSAIGRNQMIDIAKGDYILMLDSDILYINGSLEYFKNRFNDLDDNAKCIGFNPNHFTNKLAECDYNERGYYSDMTIWTKTKCLFRSINLPFF
jgi:glycosyltransferase involved in cell wall biosynthesis